MADRRLQVFQAVARHGSFTRAADALFMTQPAVTFQIKQLEEQFDTKLFERGHGRVALTPAGHIVLNYAERILSLDDEMQARVSELTDDLSGTLTLGVSPSIASYWLPGLLDAFIRHHPNVIPRIFVGNSETIMNRVSEHEADLGLVERATVGPDIDCQEICLDELMLIVAPDHPLVNESNLIASTIAQYAFIDRDPGAALRNLAEKFFVQGGVKVEEIKRVAELGSLAVIKHFVLQGFGYALASKVSVTREVNAGDLIAKSLSPQVFSSINLLVPKERFRTRLHDAFVDFAGEHLRNRVSE